MTRFASLPVMMKPPIMTPSPPSTRTRVEILTGWLTGLGEGLGLGLALGEGLGLGLGDGAGFGVYPAHGDGLAPPQDANGGAGAAPGISDLVSAAHKEGK